MRFHTFTQCIYDKKSEGSSEGLDRDITRTLTRKTSVVHTSSNSSAVKTPRRLSQFLDVKDYTVDLDDPIYETLDSKWKESLDQEHYSRRFGNHDGDLKSRNVPYCANHNHFESPQDSSSVYLKEDPNFPKSKNVVLKISLVDLPEDRALPRSPEDSRYYIACDSMSSGTNVSSESGSFVFKDLSLKITPLASSSPTDSRLILHPLKDPCDYTPGPLHSDPKNSNVGGQKFPENSTLNETSSKPMFLRKTQSFKNPPFVPWVKRRDKQRTRSNSSDDGSLRKNSSTQEENTQETARILSKLGPLPAPPSPTKENVTGFSPNTRYIPRKFSLGQNIDICRSYHDFCVNNRTAENTNNNLNTVSSYDGSISSTSDSCDVDITSLASNKGDRIKTCLFHSDSRSMFFVENPNFRYASDSEDDTSDDNNEDDDYEHEDEPCGNQSAHYFVLEKNRSFSSNMSAGTLV